MIKGTTDAKSTTTVDIKVTDVIKAQQTDQRHTSDQSDDREIKVTTGGVKVTTDVIKRTIDLLRGTADEIHGGYIPKYDTTAKCEQPGGIDQDFVEDRPQTLAVIAKISSRTCSTELPLSTPTMVSCVSPRKVF
jgi:hypothetical protein